MINFNRKLVPEFAKGTVVRTFAAKRGNDPSAKRWKLDKTDGDAGRIENHAVW